MRYLYKLFVALTIMLTWTMFAVKANASVDVLDTIDIVCDSTIGTVGVSVANSVVIVRVGATLSLCDNAFVGNDVFSPHSLILEDGAELLSMGNNVILNRVEVERFFPSHVPFLVAMPFDVDSIAIDSNVYAVKDTASYSSLVSMYDYDSEARAAYNYQFNDKESTLWQRVSEMKSQLGLLVESNFDAVVRFIGSNYHEKQGEQKSIVLKEYNYELWQDNDKGKEPYFTSAENMSWNLVGMPYLHTTNFDDMEYGRIIYKLSPFESRYKSINTYDLSVSGSVPFGTAFFTQTATLREYESVNIRARIGDVAPDVCSTSMLSLGIKAIDNTADCADYISFSAVQASDASIHYNMAKDAVNMNPLDTSLVDIFFIRRGYHYSMLSDLNIESSVNVGIKIGKSGVYEIYLPDYVNPSAYEVVALTDRYTGRVVDLKESAYSFPADSEGELLDRFVITFRRSLPTAISGLVVYTHERGVAVVAGLDLMMAYTIQVFDAKGMLITTRRVQDITASFHLPTDATYLIKVTSENTSSVLKVTL